MMEHLSTPHTVKQVAVAMGMRPHTLYHHIKVLQECGIVELVGSERLRGSIEKKYYQLTREYQKQNEPSARETNGIICFAQAIMDENKDGLIRSDQPAIESKSLVTIRSEDAMVIKEKLNEGLKQLVEKYLKPFETPDGDTVFILKTFGFLK
jgi:DNA-binding transcriptional ArsR family regulator